MMMKGDRPIDCLQRLSPLKSMIYYLMRLLPFVLVRRGIAALIALWINAVHSTPSSGSERKQVLEQHLKHLHAVRAKGWTYLGSLLPASQVSEMVQFLATRELVALNGEHFPTSAPPPGVKLASYPIRTVLECPRVIEFINRPDILRIAAAYLGCTPTVSGLRIDWSIPSSTPDYLQQFHRDYDDWRFVKLLMYLTDVGAESGPHEYVATSHLRSDQLRARGRIRERSWSGLTARRT